MDRALLPDMTIHSPEAALWRRIIWNGLLLVLKDEAPAYRGLDIWQKQFGVHARFAALLPFSHQVSAELGVKQMAIYEALLADHYPSRSIYQTILWMAMQCGLSLRLQVRPRWDKRVWLHLRHFQSKIKLLPEMDLAR